MATRSSAVRVVAACALLAGLLVPAAGRAQRYGQEPPPEAVSEPHVVADFGARFVGIDDVDSQSFAGGATGYLPVGRRLGIALGGDLGFGAVEGDFGEVVGLHTAGFWRNPELGYVGAAVVFDHVSDFQRVNVSGISALYVDRLDLLAAGGYDGGDGPDIGLFSFEIGYFTSDQLRLGGGFEFGTDETVAGGALLHWQPAADSPVTLRVNVGGGELDDEGFYSVGFGITLSFASRKSLLDQLRGDRLLVFE